MDERTMKLLALHKYWIWANRMREYFDQAIANLKQTSDGNPTAMDNVSTFFVHDLVIFMSYWYGGLYVVIEGWNELELHDPIIDGLIASPNVQLLRRYRNGAFHFQQNYFDDRFRCFIAEEGTVEWVRTLNARFSDYFLRALK